MNVYETKMAIQKIFAAHNIRYYEEEEEEIDEEEPKSNSGKQENIQESEESPTTLEYYKHEKLNWKLDPFSEGIDLIDDEDVPLDDAVSGYMNERKILKAALKKPNKLTVFKGPFGSGKTHLMKYAKKYLKQLTENIDEKIYHCDINGKDSSDRELKIDDFKKSILDSAKANFFVKYNFMKKGISNREFVNYLSKKIKGSRFYLFVDEFQNIDKGTQNLLHHLYEKSALRACILLSLTYKGFDSLDESLKSRVSESIVMNKFTEEDAIDLVKQRIKFAGGEGIQPFEDEKRVKTISKLNLNRPRWINFEVGRQIAQWTEFLDWSKVEHKKSVEENDTEPPMIPDITDSEKRKEKTVSVEQLDPVERFNFFTGSEKKVAKYIYANPECQLSDMVKAGVAKEPTIKKALARLHDKFGKYRAEDPKLLIPFVQQIGAGRGTKYKVIGKFKDMFGTT